MNATTTAGPPLERAAPLGADEQRANVDQRLDEAASVLAETLLDMWRGERRARRAHEAREVRDVG